MELGIWPKADVYDILPPTFKKGLRRPMIRFRENDESGSRTRRLGISYMCTKCDKYGHNSRKCQSKEEDLDVLKRKVTYLYFYDYVDCR